MFSSIHNFIFIHLPKTGGNSLQSVLVKHSHEYMFRGWSSQDLKNDFEIKGKFTKNKHQHLQTYYEVMPRALFEKQQVIITLRHPVERLLSRYWSPFRNKKIVEENLYQKMLATINIKTPQHKLFKYADKEFDLEGFKKYCFLLN